MKVETIDNKIILYLKKDITQNINFKDLDAIEKHFKELVIKLNDIYSIKIEGFYNIKVYLDDIYGAVLEIEQENIDYYTTDEVEMRISLLYETFLYEVDNIIKFDNINVIKKGSKYYLNVHNNIRLKDYLFILENSKLIYKNTSNIINYGNDITGFILNKIVI